MKLITIKLPTMASGKVWNLVFLIIITNSAPHNSRPTSPNSVQISKYPQSKLVVVTACLKTGLYTVTVLPKPSPKIGESAIFYFIFGSNNKRLNELS